MAEPQVTAAEQEYLESLFWLYEAGLPMSGANLARAMRLSAPTVHEMLGRLERDGFIERTDGRKIAATCPHGHPIKVGERIVGVPLADCEVGASVTILRLENEAEDLLHYLKGAGIEPGMKGTVASNDGEEVEVQSDGATATVTFSVAETVSVLADPSPPSRIALPEQLVLGGRYGR